MIWVILALILGFFLFGAYLKKKEITEATETIKNSHYMFVSGFPYNSQYKSSWRDIICLESIYFLGVVFIYGLNSNGNGTNRKQTTTNEIIEKQCAMVLQFLKIPKNPHNISIAKEEFHKKQKIYTPLIKIHLNNMMNEPLSRQNPDIINKEHYMLYGRFIELALKNYEKIMSDANTTLNFHTNPNDNGVVQFAHIVRSLSKEESDIYIAIKSYGTAGNNTDPEIDARVQFIRHHMQLLLFFCNGYRQKHFP